MRQVLSTIIGVLFGIIPVTGFMGILCYGATICAFLHFYMKKFVTLDDNELFGPSNYLVKCGLMPGFGMFMVRFFFNGFHLIVSKMFETFVNTQVSWVTTFSIVSSTS